MIARFDGAGLTWPLPLDLPDSELETRLYGEAGTKQGYRRRPEPDCWIEVTGAPVPRAPRTDNG
jgi:hypothetical protein